MSASLLDSGLGHGCSRHGLLSGLLLLLGSLALGGGLQQRQNFVIFYLVVGSALIHVKVSAGNFQRSVWHQKHGELKLGHVFTFSFEEDLERLEDLVIDAFDNPHFGSGQVVQRSQIERHGSEFGGDFAVQVARVFHFEQVSVAGLFVDGHLGVLFSPMAFAGGDQDVDGVDLVGFELVLLMLFALRYFDFRLVWIGHDNCVSDDRDEAIDVCAHVDLGKVSDLENDVLNLGVGSWRKMADAIVHGNATGK